MPVIWVALAMESLEPSLRLPAVKADTLLFAPEGWFSVRGYLSYTAVEAVPTLVGQGRTLEFLEGRLPSEKALSMRLFRYFRQGLLERRREGHQFLYRLTEKGRDRGMFLRRHYESIYEYLPRPLARRRGKPTSSRAEEHRARIPRDIPTFEPVPLERRADEVLAAREGRILRCWHCDQPLPGPNVPVCPHCHRTAIVK